MAEKRTYPQTATKSWSTIRKRFKTTIPSTVTSSYLISIGIPKDSVRSVVLPTLRKVGLIDDDDKPTDLVLRWRDDSQYPEICNQMVQQLYPDELRAIAPTKDANRSEVQSWFARDTGGGSSAVGKMTSFYMMLLEADPSDVRDSPQAKAKPAPRPIKKQIEKHPKLGDEPKSEQHVPDVEKKDLAKESVAKQLTVHFNIQIHISPEADASQIELIFQSMETHLKGFLE